MWNSKEFSGRMFIGRAIEVKNDPHHGELIKVRIDPEDSKLTDDKLPYAFPWIPKMLHIKPKVGEAVIVLVDSTGGFGGSQRYYVGPVISQPQKMWNDSLNSATSLLKNSGSGPQETIDNNSVSIGAMPKDDDIALLGRKNTDVILSDDDIKIRAGVRITNPYEQTVSFNHDSPAFIKLKYHDTPIKSKFDEGTINPHETTRSTATIFADKINLVSPSGEGWDSLEHGENAGDLISDEKMKELIAKAHQIPYGDVLCDFLSLFLKMYMEHSHPSPGAPPLNGDPGSMTFYSKYNVDKENLENKLLSKDIRIN